MKCNIFESVSILWFMFILCFYNEWDNELIETK